MVGARLTKDFRQTVQARAARDLHLEVRAVADAA
jgi:hypothetical protein